MTFPAKVRNTVSKRSGGVCEGCKQVPATEFHHRKFKSRGGKDTAANCLHLCGWGNTSGCHGKAHSADPPEGWAVHSWEDPELVPAALPAGLCWITSDGRAVPVGEDVTF